MIKKILTILLLLTFCFIPNSYAGVSYASCYQVYDRLVNDNHVNNPPRLQIVVSNKINAYNRGHVIVIYTGMLRYLKNDAEVASVLGHELGHYVLHHLRSTIPNEFAADRQGAIFMENIGYNRCVGFKWFIRLNDLGSDDHPASFVRYNVLGC